MAVAALLGGAMTPDSGALAQDVGCESYRYERVSAAPGDVTKPPGFLLEVRHGSAPPSYVLGTLHSADPAVIAAWGRSVLVAAASAIRVLFVERGPEPAHGADPRRLADGQQLRELLGAEPGLYERIVSVLDASRFPRELVDGLAPWYLPALLEQLSVQSFPTSDLVIDEYLRRQLGSLGIATRTLESTTQLAGYYADSISHAQQMRLLWEALCNRDLSDAAIAAQTAAYAADDVGRLHREMTRYRSRDEALARKLNEVLVARRNQRFWETLEPEFISGGAFVVVGNLHVFGDEGLWHQFTREGRDARFAIRRVDLDALEFVLHADDLGTLIRWVLRWARENLPAEGSAALFAGLRVSPAAITVLRERLCPGRRCEIDGTYGLEPATITLEEGTFAHLMRAEVTPAYRIDGSDLERRAAGPQNQSAASYHESVVVRELIRHLIYRSQYPDRGGPQVPRLDPANARPGPELDRACTDNRVLHTASLGQQAYLRDAASPRNARLFAISPLCVPGG